MSHPILPAPAADPWMIFHQGTYYFCESRNHRTIFVRKSDKILEIGNDPGVEVWTAPESGANCHGVWAPELHFFNGRWYIYYAADDGKNENHRMWVLESVTDDPAGAYQCRGCLETGGWAIDGTVLSWKEQLYFIWSGWPGRVDGQQNLYIAPMKNPYRLAAERVLITTPDQDWERVEMPICEGPQVLERNGKVFLVYSASASWTVDYCLGMLELVGENPLDQTHWKKTGPVFCKTDSVWGVGHCSFVKSPCATEDWILFHAKSDKKHGWMDRHVHAQRFSWKSTGEPDFGVPTGTEQFNRLGELRIVA
jgi:GH43 family beta-xylosidase